MGSENSGSGVCFDARRAMQKAIWDECIQPADNEWTTWSDCIILAETAAAALTARGFAVVGPCDADPIECGHEAARGHVEEGYRQLRAFVDKLGSGPLVEAVEQWETRFRPLLGSAVESSS
jgi:hypothetical protein